MAINRMRLLKKKLREGNKGLVCALLRELRADFSAIEKAEFVGCTVMGDEYIVRMEAQNGDEFWVAGDDAEVEEEVDGLPVLRMHDMEKLKELVV